MIGGAAKSTLTHEGHPVTALVRRQPHGPDEIHWDPEKQELDRWRLEGHQAVVHLAGEPVAEGRWNERKKARILESRRKGTRLLAEAIAGLQTPPKVMVSASAIGYYGDQGNAELTEDSGPGGGFLTEVCRVWETSTEPAQAAGVRVVHLRIGVVLTALGGALPKMLPPFQMGVGGRLGDGKAWMSWVSLEDVVGAIVFALTNENLSGPVNAVSPNPVTNQVFTKSLGRALHKPTLFPVPKAAMRLAFGELADEALLASAKVLPKRLSDAGYQFAHPELDPLLRQVLRD